MANFLRLNKLFGLFNRLGIQINPATSEGQDSKTRIAFGEISGKTIVNQFGYNNDIDTAAIEVIAAQGGTFTIMTSAATLDCASDSGNDKVLGTGARTISIEGIDGSGNIQTEIVALNGSTPVTTLNTWLGINKIFILSAGNSGVNDGNITVFETAGTTTQGYIPAGASITQQCIYHIPTGANLEIDFILPSVYKLSGGTSPRVEINGYSYSRNLGVSYNLFKVKIDVDVDSIQPILLDNPISFGGAEVLYFTVFTDTDNTEVALRFSGVQKL